MEKLQMAAGVGVRRKGGAGAGVGWGEESGKVS